MRTEGQDEADSLNGAVAVGGRSAGRHGRAKDRGLPGRVGRVGRFGRLVRRGPARRNLRIAGAVGLSLALIGGVGAVWAYQKLNGNISSSDLFSGTGSGGAEKVDAFGRSPINILLIGSDERSSSADCSLGGDCNSPGARADVEMVLHVSADRSNATVMSVPRDLETAVPQCKAAPNQPSEPAHTDMINSALNWGPGCSVAAVQQLTGIHIDHFMKVDFGGVVNMSDAVGGVQICVDKNVYDPYSHLKLSAGTHTLKGVAALEFVRTRHGFGDGSDLGRTYAQHLFLSQLVNKLKDAGTLTNVGDMWNLANAATKALTVDNGLGSITSLLGLGDELNKVPTGNITFATMQTTADPTDNSRVVIAPGARDMFDAIANDESLSAVAGKGGGTGSAKPSAPAAPSSVPVDKSGVAVKVENGTTVTGRAGAVAQALLDDGYSQQTAALTGPSAATTSLRYPAAHAAQAQAVAKSLGLPASAVKQDSAVGSIVLLIGADWPSGATFPAGSGTAPAPADTKAALDNAHAQTAAQRDGCAQVSTFATVSLPGYGPMTPTRAYELSSTVPNSAP
ncbi:LCP family protein [Streptacidiphilus fuscans]|uniref:LCP family protein n=1 Tax=Streptacidiphilus fuscans TaxID=2789292 RepID=A0A931FDS8_9ACTN|nr:LCP family protein [Streptacidiphilus fuscans]MBF9068450.1 LCP family protein [Streptacidiphilus fuscans]